MMYSRRALIGSGMTLFIAGCSSLAPPLGGEHDVSCDYRATARPFDPASEIPPEYSSAQQSLAARAIRQGTATARYGPEPLKKDSYVSHNGAYFNVYRIETSSQELPALRMTVRWTDGQQVPSGSDTYVFEDLPLIDQRALRSVVYGGLYRGYTHPEQKLVHHASPVPYPPGTANSKLSDAKSAWIRWDGRNYAIRVHGETTLEREIYEYAAEEVASDAEAFRKLIAERYLFRLDDVTAKEHEIIRQAIKDEYSKTMHSCYSPFLGLWNRMVGQPMPESDLFYIEYEGKRYGLNLYWACSGSTCDKELEDASSAEN